MNNPKQAYNILEDILDDAGADPHAQVYAQTAFDRSMKGKELDVQMKYVASNASLEYQERIAVWRGVDITTGYKLGFCQICGDRDDSKAYGGSDESAAMLVCADCYEAYGPPQTCDECATTTYEGDDIIRGPREGDYLCNTCM